MKRIKESVICLLIISVLIIIVANMYDLFLSQEKLHYTNERGLHYGPSDEILYKNNGNDNQYYRGHGIIISRAGDEGLSVSNTMRYFGIVYSGDAGFCGYFDCTDEVNAWYSEYDDFCYGMIYNDQAESARIYFGSDMVELETNIDENGFFYIEHVTDHLFEKTGCHQKPEVIGIAQAAGIRNGTEICTWNDVRLNLNPVGFPSLS